MEVIYLLILLLAGAGLTYFSGEKAASRVALLISTVAFGYSLYLVSLHYNGQLPENIHFDWIAKPSIGFDLRIDGLALLMLVLTTTLLPLIVASGIETKFANAKSLYALVLLMAFAMCGTFVASNGLLYYIFWEVALIPIYFIALIWGSGDAEERKKQVVKFFIYTFAGSLFMLVGFVYLYGKAGSLLLTDLYNLELSYNEQLLVFGGFFLAYAIKIPLIPFHTWQANVYQKAPAMGTMLLSGIMLKMGLYSVIRWQIPISPDASKELMPYLVWIGIAGVIYGSIVALRQRDLKKLLAYSSLAHVGLIAAGFYGLTADGITSGIIQMFGHGLVVVGVFFAVEVIERRYHTRAISELGGIRAQAVKFASAFLIVTLASVALPGTVNFVGEFGLLFSLSTQNVWFAVIGGLTIVLGAYYMLKMYQQVMLGEANKKPFADLTVTESLVFGALAAVIFFFGIYPQPINDLIAPAVNEIIAQISTN